ncbi:crotonobetaine/carnitine-CoA ligase [Bradyrhizobium canariense]|uniref:Crotonobetaine/carnitine-CoA ligase n=2 Tax=Bradyrhizobium canariense TaxID=255045 RepID=A0A1H1SH41_9BRAD|nr:crotonobetaine/carnitine-CoA ligase [Bradyrhizobium canariense]
MSDSRLDIRELTIGNILRRQAEHYGSKIFLTELNTGRTFTYSEINTQVNRISNGIRDLGVTHGTHVALLMLNSAENLSCFFALGKLGAVSVPINTAARGASLRYFLDQSDSEFVIVDAELLPRLVEVLDGAPKIRHVIIASAGELNSNAIEPSGHRQVAYLDRIITTSRKEDPNAQVVCSDLLLLSYTSGTTGPSKGCMVSHAAALSYGTGYIEVHGYRDTDVFYVCLPLFHNNALLAATGSALLVGGSIALAQRFSVSRFWDDVCRSGATITNFLGSISSFMWNQPALPTDRDNSLRLVSMAPTPKFAGAFEQRFGLSVMNNYGLSDFGMATAFTENSPREKLGSIGKARRGIQVRIVDDQDFEVSNGTTGEIALRAEEPWRAATGYYKMPEATAKATRNLWFHTGDRGYRDDDGYFYFVDRKKDSIRRRGENISSFEVEQTIIAHDAVTEAAAFPVKMESSDEEVGAAIVLKPGHSVSEREIIEHCQKNMAYFMVPRFIQFRLELPMTQNGKVEKYKLQEDAETFIASFWDREKAGIQLTR